LHTQCFLRQLKPKSPVLRPLKSKSERLREQDQELALGDWGTANGSIDCVNVGLGIEETYAYGAGDRSVYIPGPAHDAGTDAVADEARSVSKKSSLVASEGNRYIGYQ